MSSMFNEAFDNMFQQYINEIVAVGLFSVGYYIFQKIQPCENILEEEEKKDMRNKDHSNNKHEKDSERVYRFNQYLRDSMYQRADFDPVKILKEMKEQEIEADITTFNTLMNISVEHGNFGQTLEIFELLKGKNNLSANNITYNVLLKQLVHQSMRNNEEEDNLQLLEQAHVYIQQMKQANIKVNFISYNTILDLYLRIDKFNQGVDYLISIVQNDNFQPDMFCYTTLIRGIRQKTNHILQIEKTLNTNVSTQKLNQNILHSQSNQKYHFDIEKLFSFIQQIHDKYQDQIQIEQILFSCLIDLSFKMNNQKMVMKLIEEMKRQNMQIKLVTYGIIIKGYGGVKNSNKVQEYYNELINSGLQINEATLGCLVNALVRNNKQQQAYDLVQSNIDIVNTIIYTTLLTGFAKKKDKQMVLDIFEQMKANPKSQPNLVSYNAFMDSLISCQEYDLCVQAFQDLQQNGFEPDIISYSTYMKGLCRNKKSAKAYGMYLELKKEDKHQLDEVFFNLLLDGLSKDRQYEKAKQVQKDMIEMNIKAGIVTYSILIKFNSSINNLDECQRLWNEIKDQQLKPSLICYTCMIQVCIKQKRIDDMIFLYNEMKAYNIQPDQIFYNSLLSGFIFNKKITHMVNVILETVQQQILVGTFIYNNAIKLLSDQLLELKTIKEQEPIYDQLLKILNFIRTQQIEIDEELYSKITNQMCKFQINSKIIQNLTNLNQNKLPKDFTFNRNYYQNQIQQINENI